ncbi:UDP-N-acetylmuramate dehydrogenase [Litoribacillus peritrichatus]|uniref:UDP-N-acetylenolpyruvoylglucosamine reductase n=1 Tax=Litoribacillus peritrichatus TaxID=718191 RepID=A0ABP7N3X7_9GAMM
MLIQRGVDLKSANSFGLSLKADFYCRPSTTDELEQAYAFAKSEALDVLILGGGSNVLFSSPEYQGLVVHLNLKGTDAQQDGDYIRVTASASENWDDFVHQCMGLSAYGLENLSLIPGTVGASPVQNIGAYGVEVSDYIESVQCFDPDSGQQKVIRNEECRFGYRDSIFKHEAKCLVITSVTFRLPTEANLRVGYGDVKQRLDALLADSNLSSATPQMVSDVISQLRSEKLPDPKLLGNAGSFFKNPIVSSEKYNELKIKYSDLVAYPYGADFKLAAGWMIDQLGFKGKTIGGVAVHDKQALVLVNKTGEATSDELFELVDLIYREVKRRYGVELSIEPVVV